jgi:hypothetical protein
MLGKTVEWTSQSGGYSKTKTGTVVQVVPAKGYPDRERFPDLYKGPGVGLCRKVESYVVAVKTGKAAVRHYWPRPNGLTVVEGGAGT